MVLILSQIKTTNYPISTNRLAHQKIQYFSDNVDIQIYQPQKNFANLFGSLADPSAHIQTNRQNHFIYIYIYIYIYTLHIYSVNFPHNLHFLHSS